MRPPLRDPAIVALVSATIALAFSGKAFHIDEPLFLAPARHILSDPLHPLAFDFNWYGQSEPMERINNTPLPALYALALGLLAAGEREIPLRLFFLPWDVLAACALYLLAAQFLARPLLPTLLILLSPGYLIGLGLLYPDKLAAAAGFFGLYALIRADKAPEKSTRWLAASAASLGLSTLFKFSSIHFLIPACAYAIHRGLKPKTILAFIFAAISPLACYFLIDAALGGKILGALRLTTAWGAESWWSLFSHKARSLLAFLGGLSAAASLWPFLRKKTTSWPLIGWLLCVSAAILLFSPAHDRAEVRSIDRALGILFSTAALAALYRLFENQNKTLHGRWFWPAWTLSALSLNWAYWSVTSRLSVFIVIPVVLSLAEALESTWDETSLRRVHAASLAATAALGLALAVVDHRHASSSRALAGEIKRSAPESGKVYFAGHWGLQHYLEKEGALALDASRGGWSQPHPGDTVVLSVLNPSLTPPVNFDAARKRTVIADSAIPLRLMSGWFGQGGFYSSALGFLPYTISREPIDAFSILEL